MFGRIGGSADIVRATGTARVLPFAVNVTAGTNVLDNSNTRRRREHIQIDPDLYRQMVASNVGFALRNQIVLTMGGFSVPLTVEVLETQAAIDTVRIGVEALARFPGVSLPTTGTLSTYAPSTPVDDAAAQAAGQYYEYSNDNGSNTKVICIAPHGGNIEIGTDTWAAEMKVALDAVSKTTSIWGGRGYHSAGGQDSYSAHHISTVDTDERLNAVLNALIARAWGYSIAIHGQSGTNRIDIGCPAAINAFVDTIVTQLQARPELAGVTIARAVGTGEIDGSDNHNLCVRLAAHSVQIEATLEVRQSAAMRGAVNAVFASNYNGLP